MKRVLIHPGFLENKRHFQRLTAQLQTHGFQTELHACHNQEAPLKDTVVQVSHSGGVLCGQFESSTDPKLIVAPPLSKHRIKRILIFKLLGDIKWAGANLELRFWAYKTFWSIVAIFDIHSWQFLARSTKVYQLDLNELLDASPIRVIANTEDPFTESLCDDKRCILLDGHHDDLLYRPASYIKHISELAGKG